MRGTGKRLKSVDGEGCSFRRTKKAAQALAPKVIENVDIDLESATLLALCGITVGVLAWACASIVGVGVGAIAAFQTRNITALMEPLGKAMWSSILSLILVGHTGKAVMGKTAQGSQRGNAQGSGTAI